MGIDRTDYIMYGWKLPYDLRNKRGEKIDTYSEKLLPYIEGHKGIEYSLVEGMSCEYKAFGKVIEQGGDKYEGWDFVKLDFKNLDPVEVKDKFKELFDIDEIEDPTLFIFSNYH